MRTKIVGLILLGAIASTSAITVWAAPSDPNAATVVDTRQHDEGFDDWGLLGLLGLLGLRARRAKSTFARRPKA